MVHLPFGREDALWKVGQNSCYVPLCCFKIQGSRFDPQLVLSSAVLMNLEVVIIMDAYCSF